MHVVVMPRFDFSWKCRDCGMTSRKEPHRRLQDHMHLTHGKVWSDAQNQYVVKANDENESRLVDRGRSGVCDLVLRNSADGDVV